MRWLNTPLRTLRENPAFASIKSHALMARADFIQPLSSGLFTYGPLMVRTLHKLEKIIRDELDKQGCVEIYMPMVQPKELWEETGRWQDLSEILQTLKNHSGQEFCLGPTHEEAVTDYVRQHVKSYRDLPFNIYQIQTKYRDELRPRFGMLRAREFLMKDAYSFDLDKESALASYKKMEQAYHNIFSQLDVQYCSVRADSGAIGGDHSQEFHILADEGEDTLLISKDGKYAANKDLAQKEDLKKYEIEERRGIEIGHIFYLGKKYSEAMKAGYLDSQGKTQWIEMGCYGIGLSRVVQAVVEQSHDEAGMIWPGSISPFSIHITALDIQSSDKVREHAEKLYNSLNSQGVDCFLDDRKEAPGVKFKDADLLGFPIRVTLGERDLKQNQVEAAFRKSGEKQKWAVDQAEKRILEYISSV